MLRYEYGCRSRGRPKKKREKKSEWISGCINRKWTRKWRCSDKRKNPLKFPGASLKMSMVVRQKLVLILYSAHPHLLHSFQYVTSCKPIIAVRLLTGFPNHSVTFVRISYSITAKLVSSELTKNWTPTVISKIPEDIFIWVPWDRPDLPVALLMDGATWTSRNWHCFIYIGTYIELKQLCENKYIFTLVNPYYIINIRLEEIVFLVIKSSIFFKLFKFYWPTAQMVVALPCMLKIVGSIPTKYLIF